jgi:hypothetical protein
MRQAQDWDTRPLPEPKPRRPLQYLPWAAALGLITGLAIALGAGVQDRRDLDRLMSGLSASGVEVPATPAQDSAP